MIRNADFLKAAVWLTIKRLQLGTRQPDGILPNHYINNKKFILAKVNGKKAKRYLGEELTPTTDKKVASSISFPDYAHDSPGICLPLTHAVL